MKFISSTDYSTNFVVIRRVNSILGDRGHVTYRVEFFGDSHYSYDLYQWSDVYELLETFDFGGFNYEKESE